MTNRLLCFLEQREYSVSRCVVDRPNHVPALDSHCNSVFRWHGFAELHAVSDSAYELRQIRGVRHFVIDAWLRRPDLAGT